MINEREIKGDVPHLLSFMNCFRAGDNRWLVNPCIFLMSLREMSLVVKEERHLLLGYQNFPIKAHRLVRHESMEVITFYDLPAVRPCVMK